MLYEVITECRKIYYGLTGNPDYKAFDINRDSNGLISFKTEIDDETIEIIV